MVSPKRLIVLEAAIPTGESCEGCEYLAPLYQDEDDYSKSVIGYMCVDMNSGNGEEPDFDADGNTVRLPACRARDGFTVYPPGSAVPELVVAAKRYAAAPSLRAKRLLAHQLHVAASKVAGEGER